MTPEDIEELTLEEQRIYDRGYTDGAKSVWDRLMRDAIDELRGYGVSWEFISAAKQSNRAAD